MVAVVNNDNEDDNTNMTSATNTSFVRNEEALFQHLARLVRDEVDPDVLVAFELQSASWGYLFERAAVLEYDLMGEITRGRRTQGSFDKERDPYGFAHASGIHVPGRSVLNTWRILRSEVKSTSYTYESMVFHLLHRRVPHYSFSTLTGMYGSSGCGNNNKHSDRWRVHQYYLERVQYTQYMLDSLNIVGRTAELARLYGITFFEVLSRGSQFRVESLVMRLTKPNNYILLSPSKQQVSAQMAPECLPLVMEPQSGFYQDPLLVLDFQSLYPSIIIAYNYCYSTCVGRLQAGEGESNAKKFGATNLELPRGTIEHLRDYIFIAPNEVMFIKPEVQVGVLPRMLVEILETRVMVKAAMKRAHNNNDPALYRLLDARQLGLKLLANVTYGYTSASFSGRMPCIDIADSIVQTARETLERAIRTVNSHPTWHARVVYGDTDSLFVLLPGASRERAFEVGNEIATTITQMNPWPVKLKFEKVYHPSLLLAKKRYVGYKYESKEQVIPDFDAKGIETVRRDSCPAVAKILEKSICLLFERRDISSIRTYVQRQFHKLLVGRVSLQDLVFRKEVRLGTYAAGKSVPPAALVSTKEMERDPRAEPRYGERVPYIVAVGHRAARLIDLVYHPDYFIKYPDRLKPNSHYYITKQIIPALSRVFNLIGVDVQAWYNQMPKNTRMLQFSSVLGGGMSAVGKNAAANTKTRIDHYYMSQHCPVCDGMSQRGLCEKCRQQSPQASSLILTSRVHRLASESQHINQLCTQCCGMLGAAGRSQGDVIRCDSLDCPVLFERHRANSTLAYLTQLLHSAF
jgi:DNA polymerase zeta